MKTIPSTLIAVMLAAPAFASDICESHPQEEWMTKEAIQAIAEKDGVTVALVKEEDGCWEVKGKKDGNNVEMYFDPKTGEAVKVK